MQIWSRLALAAALVAGTACASTGEGGQRQRSDFNVLTQAQIENVRATNAYEVVERLRSRWLRSFGSTQLPGGGAAQDFEVQVYFDDVHLGGIERLRSVGYREIGHIRYYPPAEASARWGFDHGAGAIMVYTDPLETEQDSTDEGEEGDEGEGDEGGGSGGSG